MKWAKKHKLASFIVIALSIYLLGCVVLTVRHPVVTKSIPVTPTKTASFVPPVPPNIDTLWQEVNSYRLSNGLKALVRDPLLDKSATDKCQDMAVRKYWSHDAPDGTEPWVFISRYTKYRQAGENLANYLGSAQTILNAWEKSPEHDKNLLDSRFTNVGYALCYKNGYYGESMTYVIVQHLTQP